MRLRCSVPVPVTGGRARDRAANRLTRYARPSSTSRSRSTSLACAGSIGTNARSCMVRTCLTSTAARATRTSISIGPCARSDAGLTGEIWAWAWAYVCVSPGAALVVRAARAFLRFPLHLYPHCLSAYKRTDGHYSLVTLFPLSCAPHPVKAYAYSLML